jgi:hypothetical protein
VFDGSLRAVDFWASGTNARQASHLFDGMPKRCKHSQEATDATGEDRISVLPDAILQVVLSFLPSDETVQTCVLSRRWRHLWKSTPALRIIQSGESYWVSRG